MKTTKRLALLSVFFSLFTAIEHAAAQHNIIPAPVSYSAQAGQFILNNEVAVGQNQAELAPLAGWLTQKLTAGGWLRQAKGVKTSVRKISLQLSAEKNARLGNEGYLLEVKPDAVTITANGAPGIFYGIQSLLQMLPVAAEGGASAIAACRVEDYPRFGWRGLMLDVSRHFFTVEEVKQYIDLMAQYKLNVLHWHLTDDNGWRIEIKSLPKLTEIGACRVVRYGTFGERIPPKPGEAATDCNFYTQEQVKDVVDYARARQITVVPEIDVPGHSLAAIAAYPELSITGDKQMVNPGSSFSEWYDDGTFKMLLDNTLNPSDEKVYAFLDKVFGEVASLFPGTYIHAGGDECYHGYWEKSPVVQAFMKKNNLKDVHALQSYFMKRVARIIESKGKKMIGWDEILDGGLAEGAAVMSWRGMKGGIAAAKEGHYVVMSPTTHAYLDYMQADPYWEPRIYNKLYLKTCYDFDPVPGEIDPKWILGGQANLWTEKVPTFRHATYMTYPRSWAIAEAVWSPVNQKNWPDFTRRVENHFTRAADAGIQVSHALYDVIASVEKKNGDTLLNLRCELPGTVIHYSLDGTHPDAHAGVFTEPIALPEGPVVLRATTFRNGKQVGRVLVLSRDELMKRK